MQRPAAAPLRPPPPRARVENEMFSAWRRGRPPPAIWRYPAFWALIVGAAVQIAFGIFGTLISLFALLVADGARCPVALGAKSLRPFVAFLVGVGPIGLTVCEIYTRGTRAINSWTLWGALIEVWPVRKMDPYGG